MLRSHYYQALAYARAASCGKAQIIGDTSRLLPILREHADRWGVELRPFNASSFQIVAKEEPK